MSLPLHPRAPLGRAGIGKQHVLLVEHAAALITELGADLDRQLDREARASERLRMVREATNRIIRAANDAVATYRTGLRALNAEIERGGPSAGSARDTRALLHSARRDLLQTLEAAGQRYPWTELGGLPTASVAEAE